MTHTPETKKKNVITLHHHYDDHRIGKDKNNKEIFHFYSMGRRFEKCHFSNSLYVGAKFAWYARIIREFITVPRQPFYYVISRVFFFFFQDGNIFNGSWSVFCSFYLLQLGCNLFWKNIVGINGYLFVTSRFSWSIVGRTFRLRLKGRKLVVGERQRERKCVERSQRIVDDWTLRND